HPFEDTLISSDIVCWALDAPESSEPFVRLSWPVATVNTGSTSHGLVRYDAVTIAAADDDAFNGNFVAVGVTETEFRYRLLNNILPAELATAEPGESCTCSKIIHRFDEAMRAAPQNALITLSSDTFETRGFSPIFA